MKKIYFTPASAQSAIPEITRMVSSLRTLHQAIKFLNSIEVTHADEVDDFYASTSVNYQFHSLSSKFYRTLKTMVTKGYLLKDLEKGVVEFYAKHGDKEIYLSWKFGEKHMRYWHPTYVTFRERKPLSFLGNSF